MDTKDHLTLMIIRGEISTLPQDDQDKVKLAATTLRGLLETHGQHGMLALALVGAELQVAAI